MTRHGGRVARRRALPTALALAVLVADAGAQELRWSGTTSYSRGSYVFDATTQTAALYTGLGLTWGRLDVDGSIPFVLQNSQLVSQVAGVPLPTGGADNGVVGRRQPGQTLGTRGNGSGGGSASTTQVTYSDEFTWSVGDPFLSAGARVFEGSGTLRSIQTRVTVKAPVRDVDSGVGTGQWDTGTGVAAMAALGPTYVFADLSYWWYGDLADLELADGFTYSAGISRSAFGGRGSVMLSFLGSQAVIATMDRPASVGLGVSYLPRLGRSFSSGVTFGLSESSPDFSVYAGWSIRLG